MTTRASRTSVRTISSRCRSPTPSDSTGASHGSDTPISRATRSARARAAARSSRPIERTGSAPSITLSSAESTPTSAKCCCTMPTPRAMASCAVCGESTRPATRTSPASGTTTPAAILSSVLLPAPFSPTTACTSPASNASDTPLTACTAP